jgi:hypothetical protein
MIRDTNRHDTGSSQATKLGLRSRHNPEAAAGTPRAESLVVEGDTFSHPDEPWQPPFAGAVGRARGTLLPCTRSLLRPARPLRIDGSSPLATQRGPHRTRSRMCTPDVRTLASPERRLGDVCRAKFCSRRVARSPEAEGACRLRPHEIDLRQWIRSAVYRGLGWRPSEGAVWDSLSGPRLVGGRRREPRRRRACLRARRQSARPQHARLARRAGWACRGSKLRLRRWRRGDRQR